jgi:hypothetical protein
MRSIALSIVLMSAAGSAFAQEWEFGALGGGGFLGNVSANGGSIGNATAGFAPGAAFGVFAGNNLYRNLSGEIRYEYMQNDLRLSSGGQTAQFTGSAHAIHYDVIYHTNRKESRVQYFAALGGGMKLFRGTGAQEAYQPLSQFGYFTKTQAIKPMVSVGGGFTYRLSPHMYLRTEVRDFITPFPTQVLTPAPGVKYGSILQDLVPMVGISYVN